MVVPDERQDPQAALEEALQALEAALQGVPPLDPGQGREAPGVTGLRQVAPVAHEADPLRVALDEAVQGVEQGVGPGAGAAPLGGAVARVDPAGEDHRPQPPAAGPRQVELTGGALGQVRPQLQGQLQGVHVGVEDEGGWRHGATLSPPTVRESPLDPRSGLSAPPRLSIPPHPQTGRGAACQLDSRLRSRPGPLPEWQPTGSRRGHGAPPVPRRAPARGLLSGARGGP